MRGAARLPPGVRRELALALGAVPDVPSRRAEHRARAPRAPPSPRQLGRTRDGGVILRYEPTPPPDMPRPDYIPADQRHQAGYVEIEYPEHGVARVWRVPR